MKRNEINNCNFEMDNYDYSLNISVKNKEVETPKVYTINFFHPFDSDVAKYKPYFDIFERAKENDEIVIYFNSPGGSIKTLNMFLNAIHCCKCRNITAKVNFAASAAAIMTMACNNIVFNENSTLMFHTYSYCLWGKSQEIESDQKHADKMCKKIFEKYCSKIMSKEEIEQLYNGKDFYFDEQEALARLKKYFVKKKIGKRK
ncbi:MAG: ATP-dependent Clp protease proteolytic subunit [Staphylococcus sp.]|nr:ATP-dependent Clp protease proteolytic subunit [Staphylococcus sp.]